MTNMVDAAGVHTEITTGAMLAAGWRIGESQKSW